MLPWHSYRAMIFPRQKTAKLMPSYSSRKLRSNFVNIQQPRVVSILLRWYTLRRPSFHVSG